MSRVSSPACDHLPKTALIPPPEALSSHIGYLPPRPPARGRMDAQPDKVTLFKVIDIPKRIPR